MQQVLRIGPDELTQQLFDEVVIGKQQPVLVKGFALQRFDSDLWSPAYLKREYGKLPINVRYAVVEVNSRASRLTRHNTTHNITR